MTKRPTHHAFHRSSHRMRIRENDRPFQFARLRNPVGACELPIAVENLKRCKDRLLLFRLPWQNCRYAGAHRMRALTRNQGELAHGNSGHIRKRIERTWLAIERNTELPRG